MLSRIAVLISGGGTNLQALLDAKERGEIPYGEFALVLSNKEDAYGLLRAQKKQIPTAVVLKKGNQERFEEEILQLLTEYRIDMIVLAGFLSILSSSFVSRFEKRILNIHPSLLPAFSGKGMYGVKVHEAALARGVKLTGASVHYVNEIADGGEILLQRAVAVHPEDSPESLQRRVMEEAEWVLLPQAVAMVSQRIQEEKEHGIIDTKEISR